jgi:hypothetical protein
MPLIVLSVVLGGCAMSETGKQYADASVGVTDAQVASAAATHPCDPSHRSCAYQIR